MGSEWTTRRLADCATWYSGGTPSKSNPDYWEGDIPWISAKSLHDFFITHSEDRVTAAALGNGTRLVPKDSILFVVRGMSLKTEFRMGITTRPVSFNQDIKALIPADGIYPDFLAYAIRSRTQDILAMVEEAGHGTGVLPTSLIQGLTIRVPQLDDQKIIAHFFRALDDKIELNRQISTTLETMAQALFKSWFVDFDPVIDNALAAGNRNAGRPIPDELAARAERRKQLHARQGTSSSQHPTPGQPLTAAIQQQFPDRFVFTETMGWMPEGWQVSTIGEHVENTGGGTPSTKNEAFWQGGTHAFCTPKDMSRLTSWMLTDTERHLTDAGVKKVSSGLLPKRSVLMSSRAPIGYLAISNIPVSVNQGIIAMLPNASFGPLYLLSWAKFNMGNIIDRANGSTFLEISKKNFRPIPFLVPNSSVCQAFNKEAEAILEKILLLSEQNISLINLRDTLLPKLLSGQLRIPEAEQHLAEVI